MNSNVAAQNVPVLAWDGAAAIGRDIRKFVRFAWGFEVTAAIAVDAVFKVEAAPPSAGNPCVAGAYGPVPEVALCDAVAVPGPDSTIAIPAGTPVGTICTGTIPCRPNAFVRLASVSGTVASVRACMVLSGPMAP